MFYININLALHYYVDWRGQKYAAARQLKNMLGLEIRI